MRRAARRLVLAAAAAALLPRCGAGPPLPPPPAAEPGDRERLADATARAKERENAGDLRDAEAAWEEVLSLRPGHASALYATARLRRARGDLAGALARLEDLRAAEPNAGRGHLLAAEVLSDPASGTARDLAAAEARARAALSLNPEESGPQLVLGRVLLLRGRSGEAAERLENAARMNPRDPESRSLLGVLLLREGRSAEARRRFREALGAGRAAGVAATSGGVAGEGDTAASLDPGRPPTPGELRAAAGLAALGEVPAGGADGGPAPAPLRAAAEAALAARGTGEALLPGGAEAGPSTAAVEVPGGGIRIAREAGNGRVTLLR